MRGACRLSLSGNEKFAKRAFRCYGIKMQQFSRHEQLQKYAIKQDAFRKVICENCAGTY